MVHRLVVGMQTSNALGTSRDTQHATVHCYIMVYIGVCTGQSAKDKHTWNKFLSATTSQGFTLRGSKIRVNSGHRYIGGYASRNVKIMSNFLSAREISMNT